MKSFKKVWGVLTTALTPTLSSYQTVREGADGRQHIFRWKKFLGIPFCVERVTEGYYIYSDEVTKLQRMLELKKKLAEDEVKKINASLQRYGISKEGTVFVSDKDKGFISAEGVRLTFEFKPATSSVKAEKKPKQNVVEEWNHLVVCSRPPSNSGNNKGNNNNR